MRIRQISTRTRPQNPTRQEMSSRMRGHAELVRFGSVGGLGMVALSMSVKVLETQKKGFQPLGPAPLCKLFNALTYCFENVVTSSKNVVTYSEQCGNIFPKYTNIFPEMCYCIF